MPLAFQSLSHGQIAFGFFNIESDMLLLEHYFFFADEFCRHISALADSTDPYSFSSDWEVFDISNRMRIGDLMGAIHGLHYEGFIGEVYKRFPFPKSQEEFKQKPEGHQTREVMKEIIEKYGVKTSIQFSVAGDGRVSIGEYVFGRRNFLELIRYVWLGGYPRWKDRIRPDYVLEMKKRIEQHKGDFFSELSWEE